MSGIDEREEFEENTFDGRTPNRSMANSKNSSSRASQLKQYNFQSHSTPNSQAKRLNYDSAKKPFAGGNGFGS